MENYEVAARIVGDRTVLVLGDGILGLTHHHLGNQETARTALERARRIARQTGRSHVWCPAVLILPPGQRLGSFLPSS